MFSTTRILHLLLHRYLSTSANGGVRVHTFPQKLFASIPPSKLFTVVTSVTSYSEFLPFCTHSEILPNNTLSSPKIKLDHPTSFPPLPPSKILVKTFPATLTIGYTPLLSDTYTSSVTIKKILDCDGDVLEYRITSFSSDSTLFSSIGEIYIINVHVFIHVVAFDPRLRLINYLRKKD